MGIAPLPSKAANVFWLMVVLIGAIVLASLFFIPTGSGDIFINDDCLQGPVGECRAELARRTASRGLRLRAAAPGALDEVHVEVFQEILYGGNGGCVQVDKISSRVLDPRIPGW
jgi:hypothetical protein